MRLPLPGWLTGTPAIPVEESTRDGYHVVRAEMPGLDPFREISVMVADNAVTIEICRPVHLPGPADGEFHEPPVRRTVQLPPGAKDDTLTATYDGEGILEVRVELTRTAAIGRKVPIAIRRPSPRIVGKSATPSPGSSSPAA